MNPSRLTRLLIPVLGTGVILGVGAVAALKLLAQPAPDTAEHEPLPVATVSVAPADGYEERRRFAGTVSARRQSALGFDRGGRLLEVLVDDGDTVLAGELLARLDTARLAREREELQATLAGAEADLRLAELTRDRNRDLNRRGVASAQTVDETRLQAEAVAARVRQLQVAIDRVALELDRSLLHAPFDGVVVARLLDEGVVVDTGEPLLRLLEEAPPEARVGVPVSVARELAVGQRHTLLLNDRQIAAGVRAVLPAVDAATRTVTVVLDLPAGATAPDGALVHLLLAERIQSPGFWVPLSALTEGLRGLWTAYALAPGEDGPRVNRREVEVLHVDGDRAFVRGTLEADLTLVADGVHRLVAGQRVAPAGEALAALEANAP